MKLIQTFVIFILALTQTDIICEAQVVDSHTPICVPIQVDNTACLSNAARERIIAENKQSILELTQKGILKQPNTNFRAQPAFNWPIQLASTVTDPGFFGISNYVDQDITTAIQDYNCGSRTYDGHNGIDMFTWPFAWQKVTNSEVEILAAIAGTIIGKVDGFDDQHCSCVNYDWNAVYIQHSDGTVAWYGHMKKGTTTSKSIGQTVSQGEKLGIVGSSGCSSAPHLHFEVYQNTTYQRSNLVEPFGGTCNTLSNGNTSWWATTQNYRVPTLNKISTHYGAPVLGCPTENEDPKIQTRFLPGSTVYFAAYFRDLLQGHTISWKVYSPSNTLFLDVSNTNAQDYNAAYYYYYNTLPLGNIGTWRFELTYLGQTTIQNFEVVTSLPVELLNFQVKNTKNSNILSWQTASETNFSHFDIEKSIDGIYFEKIGEVKGRGFASNYEFNDLNPMENINYYRLRMIDVDSKSDFSKIISQSSAKKIKIFPNPTSNILSVLTNETIPINVLITDGLGRTVVETVIQNNKLEFDVSNLPNGVYLVEIKTIGQVMRDKFLKN